MNHFTQWIGLRENLQETIDFPIQYGGIPVNFPLNQSIDLHGVAFSKVSVDALVEAEGSCAFQATKKRFLSMGGFLKWGYTPVHHRFQ